MLRVDDIYKLTAIKIFHKYKNDKPPPFFADIFELRHPLPEHNHDLRQRQQRLDTPNTVGASQSPKFCIPTIIDNVSPEITAMFETESLNSIVHQMPQKNFSLKLIRLIAQ